MISFGINGDLYKEKSFEENGYMQLEVLRQSSGLILKGNSK